MDDLQKPMGITRILDWYKKYHRLTNYIGASMLYLKDNCLLERALQQDDIKPRILGHWGTVSGLNFIYGGLNYIITKDRRNLIFVAGPGHGAPAVLANTFLEGSLKTFYPEKYPVTKFGLENLIRDFSWPGAFPSHTTPDVPGSILEGGELGYSLATAFGAIMDKPDLTAVCVVGDGEAETATLAASWQSNKFINPSRDGAVLPILHLNGYRISGPTIFGTMSNDEIEKYFTGLGYKPYFVDQYTSDDIYIDFLEILIQSFERIDDIKKGWAQYGEGKPVWPVIILKTKKGWSGPQILGDKKIEDNNLSHGIPLQKPKSNVEEFDLLKQWLESYQINELLDNEQNPNNEVLAFIPDNHHRMGTNPAVLGGYKKLDLPSVYDHEFRHIKAGERYDNRMENTAEYLRDVFDINKNNRNFRLFSPDESESNTLKAIFSATDRGYIWPVRKWDEYISKDGRIMELLSENVLFGWLQGYLVTGRHGILISYEAFLNVVSSQIDQYLKFLRQWKRLNWRKSIASLNLVATSTLWRQEHNGFTHQNPTLINSLITKYSDDVKLYFPSDINSLILTLDKTLSSESSVNLIVACKRDTPQWMTIEHAQKFISDGFVELKDFGNNITGKVDVMIVSIGDYQTMESAKAAELLKQEIPEISFKFINVGTITQKGLGNQNQFIKDFLKESNGDIIINFHGYPTAIQQLLWGIDESKRIKVYGYTENGTTTTPFDMQVRNNTSRFNIAIEAIKSALKNHPELIQKGEEVIEMLQDKLQKHHEYILDFGEDMEEVRV